MGNLLRGLSISARGVEAPAQALPPIHTHPAVLSYFPHQWYIFSGEEGYGAFLPQLPD